MKVTIAVYGNLRVELRGAILKVDSFRRTLTHLTRKRRTPQDARRGVNTLREKRLEKADFSVIRLPEIVPACRRFALRTMIADWISLIISHSFYSSFENGVCTSRAGKRSPGKPTHCGNRV